MRRHKTNDAQRQVTMAVSVIYVPVWLLPRTSAGAIYDETILFYGQWSWWRIFALCTLFFILYYVLFISEAFE